VAHYRSNQGFVEVMLKQLSEAILGSPGLMAHVHSTKARMKDPDHLEDKLLRKRQMQKLRTEGLRFQKRICSTESMILLVFVSFTFTLSKLFRSIVS